ncbi:MAG: DUF4258 domain-containing protein [Thermoanaerobaculia bacterium]
MSRTLERILDLVSRGEVRVSDHGYDELAADGILVRDVLAGVEKAEVVEDYPESPKGPSVLALQEDERGGPIHVVWGVPKGKSSPAVLITAYRPDPGKWTADFRHRKR